MNILGNNLKNIPRGLTGLCSCFVARCFVRCERCAPANPRGDSYHHDPFMHGSNCGCGYYLLPDLLLNQWSQDLDIILVGKTGAGIDLQAGEGIVIGQAKLQDCHIAL